jgi:glutamate/aspartate transport system substrate-binding protein
MPKREREERMNLGLNFRRIIFGVTALLIVLPLLSVQEVDAQALDGTLKKIKDSGTMNLGYLADAPPFSFLGPDKKPAGYSVELCTRIAGSIQKQLNMNLKLNWVAVTAENRISMVEQGKIDIECGTTTTSLSRYEKVDFSLMTYVDGGTLLTLANSPLRSLTDLSGKKIAVITGTTTESALAKFLKEQFVTGVQLMPVKDHVEGRTALESGTVEAFASDQAILIAAALTAKDPKRFALADGLFSYEPYAFMLRRNDPSFRLAVNRALATLYRSGEILPIYDSWFGALGKVGDAIEAMYMINGLPD